MYGTFFMEVHHGASIFFSFAGEKTDVNYAWNFSIWNKSVSFLFNIFTGNNITKFTHSSTFNTGNNSINTDIHVDSDLVLSEEEFYLYVQKLILNDEILHEIIVRIKCYRARSQYFRMYY